MLPLLFKRNVVFNPYLKIFPFNSQNRGTSLRDEVPHLRNTLRETNGQESDENALELLEKFCNTKLQSLTRNQHLNNFESQMMDIAEMKNDKKKCSNPEPKRGKQLTSIIDQLKINKTKDSAPNSKNKKKNPLVWQPQTANDGE
ncbi:uncharacterized protein CDAR_262911 [Caerostris darwini]|uniref:Uncharacterized protein n=1 Tax=Caerostris darwini TaxID=1538125 RepID=A0AAV4S0K0_9ARAC|nr:uncharacterized protein CDAR_262911 [Caerostris darwini]